MGAQAAEEGSVDLTAAWVITTDELSRWLQARLPLPVLSCAPAAVPVKHGKVLPLSPQLLPWNTAWARDRFHLLHEPE